jgi:hypothetical protein
VDHIEERGKEFLNLASQQGLEGIVAKDKKSPYVSGRQTWHWLKIKNRQFQRRNRWSFKPIGDLAKYSILQGIPSAQVRANAASSAGRSF